MVNMDKKIILLMLILCTFCLIGTVSASDADDVIGQADEIAIAQSADIDIATQSESNAVAADTSTQLLADGEDGPGNEPPVSINQTVGVYIGGNDNDKGKGIYTDADGNIYEAMETFSNDLITTEGAYQTNISGGKDLYVSKYTASGDLIYATYIGGSTTEMQKDLKVDSLGNVYVIGFTNSPNFPTTANAFQKEVNGSQDAFLTVLNPTGTGLVYSTYLGGNVVDRAWALAIDDNGTAYIQGITNSINFPVTDNAYQKSKDGVNWSIGDPDDIDYQNSFDLFLSKINIYSGDLQYSTFFGAKGSDSTYGSVAVDKNEVIYFAGTTTSLDFPVTENAFRDVRAEQSDSFLSALDIRNNKLLFSSYVGGNSTDDGEAIVLSENGFLYYVGDTWSEDFPTTEGAYQTSFAGVGEGISGGDMFIMKIDTSNWNLVYATLLGGKFDEGVRALAVDENECAWVVGMSQSDNYPVTDDAYQKVKNGPKFISYANSTDMDYPTHDTVISKISPDGSELLYSTYYGGNSGEFAMGITFVNGGFAIQIRTCSDDLNVTDNSSKGQDKFNGSMLGRDPVYDFDSYIAVFENPTFVTIENISSKMGEEISLTANVKQAMGNAPVANQNVEFYVGSTLVGNATTDENGVATLTYNPTKPLSDNYTAVFKETKGHAAANASASINIAYYDIPTVSLNNNSSIIQRYGTYLGGNGFDKGKAAFVDKDGNIYVAMESNSRDYVTTPGAFQSEMAGARDIVVAKFSKDGELLYLTYFGGSGNEMHKDFKVDENGNAYVVGFTNSPNFPVTDNAIMKEKKGIQNAFLAVFDSNGNLTFSTLIGGVNVDRAFAVALDDEGNAYVQGITNSPDFPVTDDAFQKEKNGPVWNNTMSSADITFQDSFDLFITKVNVKDAKIEYSTFFGGETMDTTEGTIDVDKNGIIYFGGYTSGLLLNVTDNAFQKEFQGTNDAFITVLDPVNNKLVYSSYIGGEDDDIGGEIVVSDEGYLYYVGDTWSKEFPVTDNAYQKEYGGCGNNVIGGDAYIMKFNTTSWDVMYSSYLGSYGDDGIGDLEIDDDGNLYLLFHTESSDFPVTDDAYQLEKNGIPYGPSTFDNDYPTLDAAVVKLSEDGSKILYSTFFGGSSGEQAFGFALNQGGFVLFIRTYSGDMFVTDDAYQPQHGNDSVASSYGRDLYYMDNYLGIFENPTIIKVEDLKAKGGNVDLVATVNEAMGNNPLVNKSVDFYVAGEFVGTALTDENGVATLPYKVSSYSTVPYEVVFNETLTHAKANASAIIDYPAVDEDAVVEINPNSSLINKFATYLGGNGNDKAKGVYVDEKGNIYVAMETDSTDIPTTPNAYQSKNNGGKDLFVAKYSAEGELIYATYIGGSKTEMQKDIKVDSQGNVYLTGFGNSPDLPVTDNAFQKELPGAQAAFLVVLNPEGTDLVYSSYLGGDVVDRAWALAIDDNGSAYIQGITNSLNFPVTPDAFQKSKDGVNWSVGDPDDITYQDSFDLFLAKFNINTGNLEYATYFGAKGSDSTYGGLAVDNNEVMYFTGSTTSIDFPVTENAYRDVRDAGSDSFLAALDIKNGKLLFSTYIGGNGTEEDDGLFLDKNGFLYFIGDTWSENFPVTENAYQTKIKLVNGTVFDASSFIMKIDTSNWNLVYSTLLGGSLQDGIRAITVDEDGNAYVSGLTQSTDFPVTSDAYQVNKSEPNYESFENPAYSVVDYDYPTHDAFIAKLSADGSELLYGSFYGGNAGEFGMGITLANGGFIVQMRTTSTNLPVSKNAPQKEHAIDVYGTSILGRDYLYDYDNYFVVFENPTIILAVDLVAKSGETVNLTASVCEAMGSHALANKSVDFYVDGVFVGSAVSDEDGIATLEFKAGSAKDVVYSAVFNETLGHAGANISATLKVIEQTASISDITIDSNLTLSGILKDGEGNPIANATVSYSLDDVNGTVVTDENGLFAINAKDNAKLTIEYAGSEDIAPVSTSFTFSNVTAPTKLASQFNITNRAITITGYAVDGKANEQGIYYATELLDEKGNPIANAYIEFAVNNKIYNRTTNENGTFDPYKLNMVRAGRYTMAFSFAGDDNYTSAFACVCVDLDKKPLKIKAAAKSFKASAKTKKYTVSLSTIKGLDGKMYLSPKTVKLTVNGKTYTATTKNGKATFKITNLNKKGKFTAKLSVKGDKTYEDATAKAKLTIK